MKRFIVKANPKTGKAGAKKVERAMHYLNYSLQNSNNLHRVISASKAVEILRSARNRAYNS